jgi:hypothetical protein
MALDYRVVCAPIYTAAISSVMPTKHGIRHSVYTVAPLDAGAERILAAAACEVTATCVAEKPRTAP